MAAEKKVSKASVKYGQGGDHCGVCKYFIEEPEGASDDESGACEKVAGAIGEDMWCKLFSRRRGTVAHGSYES